MFRRRKRSVGPSWRIEETYVKVAGQCKYLYRAVDCDGKYGRILAARQMRLSRSPGILRASHRPALRTRADHHRQERREPSGDHELAGRCWGSRPFEAHAP